MSFFSIVASSLALTLGSLLVATLLTCAAWSLAERLHRAWVAPVSLLLTVIAMIVTPLEQSLFVRMLAVFSLVGAAMLYFVGPDEASLSNTDKES